MSPITCLLLHSDTSKKADGLSGLDDTHFQVTQCSLSDFDDNRMVTAQVLMLKKDLIDSDYGALRTTLNAVSAPRVLVFDSTLQVDTRLLQQWPLDDYVALDWEAGAIHDRISWIMSRYGHTSDESAADEVLSADAVLQLDANLKITDANDMAELIFSHNREQLCSMAITDLFAEASLHELQSVLQVSAVDTETYTGRTTELLALQGDGLQLPVEAYVRQRQTGSVVMFVRDISSHQHYRGAYFRHEMQMRSLGRLAEDLLNSEKTLAYGNILRLLVPAMHAMRGRFYLTAFDKVDGQWQRECVAEWWAEQRPDIAFSTRDLSESALERDRIMKRWLPILANGEVVASPADSLPENESAILSAQGVKSLLVVPLILKDKLLGFMRFDSPRAYPGWEAGDVGFLKSAARSICHAYATLEERRYRIETQEELYHERVWLETIRQASELITSTDSMETRLTDIAMFLLNVIPVDQFIVSTHEQGRIKVNGVYTLGRELKSFQYWADSHEVCQGHGIDHTGQQTCNHSSTGMEIIESGKVMQSCVCLPLIRGDEQLGTMSLASEEKGVFNDRNRTHLESLATQMAHVVVHIKRYQAAKSEVEHLAVIVREVHHRIKNNLQGVIGLLNRHRNQSPEVEQVMAVAIAQLNAIAEAHNQLSRRPNETVFLGDLVSGVCRAVKPLTAHTISIDEQSADNRLVVPAAEVVPVALVVNELIQNALDHGFESDEGGNIRVRIRESGEQAMLSVANDGKPLPESLDSGSGNGFGTGLTLVRSLLPSNGSNFSLSHDDGWTVAQVSYDVPAIMHHEAG